jgi:hypothetical protein
MSSLRHAGLAVCSVLVLWAAAEAGPPALLGQARYVALGYDRGDRFVSEAQMPDDVLPEERAALQALHEGLEQWGRYVVVVRPEQAELLIAVRKGRLVSVGGGIRRGGPAYGPGGPIGSGPGVGVQVSSPDDMIEVFDARGGSLVWRSLKPNGLAGAGPPLFDAFRAEVAKADRSTQRP